MFTLSKVARCGALGAFVAMGGFDFPLVQAIRSSIWAQSGLTRPLRLRLAARA